MDSNCPKLVEEGKEAELKNQIAQRLLLEPTIDASEDVIWIIMLRWVCLLDIKLLQPYLKERMDKARASGQLSVHLYPWSEVENWPEHKQRAHSFGDVMMFIVNAGFDASKDEKPLTQPQIFSNETESINQVSNLFPVAVLQSPTYTQFSIYNTVVQLVDRDLADQLLEMLPEQAVNIMSNATCAWAWGINPQRVKEQITISRYYIGGTAHSDLIFQIFYNLYLSLESLWWHGFTNEIVNNWRA